MSEIIQMFVEGGDQKLDAHASIRFQLSATSHIDVRLNPDGKPRIEIHGSDAIDIRPSAANSISIGIDR